MNDFPAEDRLPFSRPADVAANREARISGRQQVGLWYSGLWRLTAGLPAAGVGYSPPIPDLGSDIGSQVDVYFNARTAGYVLAIRLRETLYANDYYLNPEHQKDNMISSRATIALLSVIARPTARWSRPLLRAQALIA